MPADDNLQATSYLQIDINVLIGLASCVDYGSFSQAVFATRAAGGGCAGFSRSTGATRIPIDAGAGERSGGCHRRRTPPYFR